VMRQYEQDTWYDAAGRIVFTASKGLVGVGLPRRAGKNDAPCTRVHPDGRRESKPLGWEDVRELPAGWIIEREIDDDTRPGGPIRRTIRYVAPFDRCAREDDYARAWAEFAGRIEHHESPVSSHQNRTPPPQFAGKVKELGDVMTSVPPSDWGVK